MIRICRFTTISLLLGVLSIRIAFAQQSEWERTLATTASLRTAGARLVTSDALRLEDGDSALITYWETAGANDLAVYRCVDVVDSDFDLISQTCWKVLAPTGTGPLVPLGRRPSDVG